MIRVTFCVKDVKSNYRVTAHGTLLEFEDGDEIRSHAGQTLAFAIDQEFGDIVPFAEHRPTGIVSAAGKKEFYEFEVLSGSGQMGILRILKPAKERSCLSADAP
jgi:hypothetical protein